MVPSGTCTSCGRDNPADSGFCLGCGATLTRAAAAGQETEFLGRQHELAELRALLEASRLLTITGTGGIGKTRLALELARTVSHEFADGVWVAELARIEDAKLVPEAIAGSVHAPPSAGITPLQRVTHKLADARALLLLDNCEHLLTAAGTACTFLVAHCLNLHIVATSREPLGITGEHVWSSPTLTLPRGDDASGNVGLVGDSEAVQLFCHRAQLVAAHFSLSHETAADIALICRRLDGLPLAIELAAAWVPFLSLSEIARRLDDSMSLLRRPRRDRASRHLTMQAALDWSIRLLSPSQRAAFRRLSVFVGGFTADGAESLLRGLSHTTSELELLAALVERSLVVADTTQQPARFRMLEPVRQYATARLDAHPAEQADATMRHLVHMMEVAEAAEEPLLGGPDLPWLRRLDEELPNIRAALSWGLPRQLNEAARLAASLIWFCYMRNLYEDGREWALRAMQISEGTLRARAAHMAGTLAAQVGAVTEAECLLAEAQRLLVHSNASKDLVMVLADLGVIAYHRADFDTMRRRGHEALELARSIDDEARVMQTLWHAGVLAEKDGDLARACDIWKQASATAERRNIRWIEGMFLMCLVNALVNMDDFTAALHALRKRLKLCAVLVNDPISDAAVIETAGIMAIHANDPAVGLHLMAAARAARERAHYRHTAHETERADRWIQQARDSLGAEADAAWESGLRMSTTEAIDAACEMAGLASARCGEGAGPRVETIRAFMFTDIVRSTELVAVIGDEAWHELVEWHHETLRALFMSYHGEEVDNAGDGFFVAFVDTASAIRCAVAIQETLAAHRRRHGFAPRVRIGVHASASVRGSHGYHGEGVHRAARIAALAEGDEIILSEETARQLAGAYVLSPPRCVALKGVRQEVPVVSLRWSG